MKWVLGLGGSNHDFSATLLKNGTPHTLIEDERLTRHRYGDQHWASSPCKASALYCLENAGIEFSDLDGIFISNDIEGVDRFWEDFTFHEIGHHLCHASAAHFTSPFERSALLVIDGKGGPIDELENGRRSFETISTGRAQGNEIALEILQSGDQYVSTSTWQYISSNSIGWFYSIVTECVGMGLEGEGKTMALAAFGEPRFKSELLEFINSDVDQPFIMDPYGGIYSYLAETVSKAGNSFSIRADLAASAQAILEDSVLSIAKKLQVETGERTMAYGGGVALNGLINSRLRNECGFEDVFVFPATGDNGLSTGAALYGYHCVGGNPVTFRSMARSVSFAACGKTYSTSEIENAARSHSVSIQHMASQQALIDKAVSQLISGSALALYQGGSEFGPRALGNRSIIALPSVAGIQRKLNLLKRRESFRPFAPIVLEEDVSTYFDTDMPSPFMLEIVQIRTKHQAALAGASHVDGSARLQTVATYQDGLVRQILGTLKQVGLLPVILNTSFNLHGHPIVETPEDALHAFARLDIDSMILGHIWVEKHS